MTKLLLSGIATLMLSSAAMATPVSDALLATYRAQGFTNIDIDIGPTRVHVEAVSGTVKVEALYDGRTGALIDSQTRPVRRGDDASPEIEIEHSSRDPRLDTRPGRGGDDDDWWNDDDRWDDDDDDDDDDRRRGHRWDDDDDDDDDRWDDDDDDDRWDNDDDDDDRWDD